MDIYGIVTACGFVRGCVGAILFAAGAHAAEARRFDVSEYRVLGNTVLSAEDIETAVYPFLGPEKTEADVQGARDALTAAYAKRGFATVATELPQQTVTSGIIRLAVRENPVGRLRVTGSKYTSLDVIRAGAPSVAEGRVLNVKDLQREIVALNQVPGRTIVPELRPGREPNTVDVDLKVDDGFAAHGSVELNNRQQVGTSALRQSTSVSYDNVWQRGDSASVSFQLAPQSPAQSEILAASYLFRIPGSTLALLSSYTHSSSNVTTLGSTAVLGSGDTLSLRLQIPLWFEPGFTQNLSVGGDWKRYQQNLTLAGSTSTVPITYYPAGISYFASWTEYDAAEATTTPIVSTTDLSADFVLGTRGLGSGDLTFENNRYRSQASFSYLRTRLDHTRFLPYGFQAYARGQTQLTNDPLIPQEQLSLGGVDSVRGYYETEVLADYGGVVQAELRSPDLVHVLGLGPAAEVRFHAFVDAARGGIHKPLPENGAQPAQRGQFALSSTGIGARVNLYAHLHGEIENAVILAGGPNTKTGADRVLFRVYGDF